MCRLVVKEAVASLLLHFAMSFSQSSSKAAAVRRQKVIIVLESLHLAVTFSHLARPVVIIELVVRKAVACLLSVKGCCLSPIVLSVVGRVVFIGCWPARPSFRRAVGKAKAQDLQERFVSEQCLASRFDEVHEEESTLALLVKIELLQQTAPTSHWEHAFALLIKLLSDLARATPCPRRP